MGVYYIHNSAIAQKDGGGMKRCIEVDVSIAATAEIVQKNIVRLLEATPISVKKIASDTGVTGLYTYTRGVAKTMTFVSMIALSVYFDVSLDFFLVDHTDEEIASVAVKTFLARK